MSDHVGVFIDGRYLLHSGVDMLLAENTPKITPHRFNVLEFKSAVVRMVERLVPDSRILRIYWYESEAEAESDEYQRRLVLAKNGIKLRIFPFEDDEDVIASTVTDLILDDIDGLANHRAITDAVIVNQQIVLDDRLELIQSRGVHVHLVEVERRDLDYSLDIRASVDTYSPWTTQSLRDFLLPDDGRARDDQNRILDPDEYGIDLSLMDEIEDEEASDAAVASESTLGAAGETSEWSPREDTVNFEDESAAFTSVAVDSEAITPYVRSYVEKMLDPAIRACVDFWSGGRRDVPPMHDKMVLAACREGAQRNLMPEERKVMRDEFMRIVNQQYVERSLDANPPPRLQDSLKASPALPFGENFSQYAKGRSGSSFEYALPDQNIEVASEEITEYVELFLAKISDDDLLNCLTYWQSGQYGVPSVFDKGVMAVCREELHRNLSEHEKHFMRAEFKRIVNELASERGIA